MAGPFDPARLPGVLFQRNGGGLAPIPPGTVIERVVVGDYELEEYQPLPRNLEWRLSALHWIRAGVTPFLTNDVPYLVNNNGRASADAAAVLFANCIDTRAGEPISVLEIGAGTALFARYFLDEFRALCQRHDRDFYNRLAMRVTDGSPASVARWAAAGMFADHGTHVSIGVCDAQMPERGDGALRALFANYVLDSLPAAVLRRDAGGWQQLCARASIRADTVLPRSLAGRDAAGLRKTASTTDLDELADLLPLLPVLESELSFRPINGNGPPDYERHLEAGSGPITSVIYPYGALQCLDALIPRLHPDGFALIRDYAAGNAEPRFVGAQRFGGAVAMPLNFAVIERHLQSLAVDVVRPDNEGLMHTRLLARAPIAGTRAAFVERFSVASTASEPWTLEAVARERAAQGLNQEALDVYRQAIADHPRDWRLIAAAAQFAASTLGDHVSGVDLACAALQLNPWYSPVLWNVLGECLRAAGRDNEAHDCHLEAARVHPGDAETYIHLAKSWLTRGEAASSLEAVAKGLAADVDSVHRHPLLEVQAAAIERLSRAGTARREVALRRYARGSALASTAASIAAQPDRT